MEKILPLAGSFNWQPGCREYSFSSHNGIAELTPVYSLYPSRLDTALGPCRLLLQRTWNAQH